MSADTPEPRWSLPYEVPAPRDPRAKGRLTVARVGAYLVLIAAVVAPSIQFQVLTQRNHERGIRYRRDLEEFKRTYGHLSPAQLAERGLVPPLQPKVHKGAVARWRQAVYALWDGQNIYRSYVQAHDDPDAVWMHPNMPITVIALTPLALLPVPLMAAALNVCKALVLLATILMAARIAAHGRRRIPDWVLGLGLLWVILLIVGDIQHGNTNVFVLGAITLHVWLYRRGRDLGAGAALAAAICLKMTPALFALYWLYQRNWKLLAGLVAAMLLLGVVIPAVALGPAHYATLTATWCENLIGPGLVKGSWYPIHINQSLSGVFSRYFFSPPDPNGNIFWNPDDAPYDLGVPHPDSEWITLVGLSPATAKRVLRIGQLAIVALLAWAIGWRKLPRDDGRRALHYGLIVIGILLLNQRTWDHHAPILLLANVAIWQAIAFGRFGRKLRRAAVGLMVAAGPLVWLTGTEIFKLAARLTGRSTKVGDHWADVFDAYGPTFYHFVLLLAAATMLCLAMKKSPDPYAPRRQTLRG